MTNDQIKNLYESAEKAIAVLDSSEGTEIKISNPELYKEAQEVIEENRAAYFQILLNEKPEVTILIKETEEAVEAMKYVSDSSHSAVLELNTLIKTNTEKVQDQLLFNEQSFYDKYFLTLPSKIKEEEPEKVMENERFKEWFANSKVINDSGEPLIVYHGTGGIDEFTVFKFSPFPANYFAVKKSYAEWFSAAKKRNTESFLFKCYLRVTNPIDLTDFKVEKVAYDEFVDYIKYRYGYTLPLIKMLKVASDRMNGMEAWLYLRNGVDWLKYISEKNDFDGFCYYENNPQDLVNGEQNITKAWMIFKDTQIMAADKRNTTYSLFAKDIRMKKGGAI